MTHLHSPSKMSKKPASGHHVYLYTGMPTTHQVDDAQEGYAMEIRLRGTKEGLGLALRKLEQVFEVVKYLG